MSINDSHTSCHLHKNNPNNQKNDYDQELSPVEAAPKAFIKELLNVLPRATLHDQGQRHAHVGSCVHFVHLWCSASCVM